MSNKRKYNDDVDNEVQNLNVSNKKHSLDSDEEDSDDYQKGDLCDSDIEGEEEGVSKIRDEVKITPFNMREELEEGHFDNEGHYHWNKSSEIKDNWLDNIDWVKIGKEKDGTNNKDTDALEEKTLDVYNEVLMFKELLSYMIEGETVAGTLRRLGKKRAKMSSVERLKLRKQGIPDENADKITKISELSNQILTKTGDMDIYQATYESIRHKINSFPSTSKKNDITSDTTFDMYSDDFNEKERLHKEQLVEESSKEKSLPKEILWEFKWKEDDDKLQGPYTSEQMFKWSIDGYFKSGVYVRKVGEFSNFHSSNRIDFDLYL